MRSGKSKKLSWKLFALFGVAVLCLACGEMDLGREALKIGDFKRASENFSKVLDGSPSNAEARYGNALALFGLAEETEREGISSVKLWHAAADEFRILYRVDSSEAVRPMYSNCLFYLARAELQENNSANVASLLARSVALDSTNYFSLNLEALLLETEGKIREAEQTFILILSRSPKFAAAYMNLGNLYWKRGQVDDAWEIWSMGRSELPMNEELIRLTALAEDSIRARAEGLHAD